ncbi:hypothetical protein V1504DRAFT_459564 [Lipomyces starkeyi]
MPSGCRRCPIPIPFQYDLIAIGRDVHFFNFAEPDKALGGLILNPSVTKKNFLSMLGILIVTSGPYRVTLRSTGHDLTPTDEPLQPGQYDIRHYSRKDTICITDEPCIIRIISQSSTGRDTTFRTQVRERDGKDNWSTFHAAHIFPLSSEDYFVQSGFSRWNTNRIGERDTGINSCQNGLLMRIDGRILDPVCRDPNDNRRVRHELRRWHFRQAVLANMRGAGKPSFETDFPPGTDMMGEILSGPIAAKRMEAELFSRLGGGTLESL